MQLLEYILLLYSLGCAVEVELMYARHRLHHRRVLSAGIAEAGRLL